MQQMRRAGSMWPQKGADLPVLVCWYCVHCLCNFLNRQANEKAKTNTGEMFSTNLTSKTLLLECCNRAGYKSIGNSVFYGHPQALYGSAVNTQKRCWDNMSVRVDRGRHSCGVGQPRMATETDQETSIGSPPCSWRPRRRQCCLCRQWSHTVQTVSWQGRQR